PMPTGIVQLAPVDVVVPGATFAITGRVHGVPRATLVLRDPAGQRIGATAPDALGGFRLDGLARLPGPSSFRIEVLDASRKVV
uniref:hypothetical protein n=1 Tax=Salmonella enterica TaxID=28901 RepID=UPI0020C42AD0